MSDYQEYMLLLLEDGVMVKKKLTRKVFSSARSYMICVRVVIIVIVVLGNNKAPSYFVGFEQLMYEQYLLMIILLGVRYFNTLFSGILLRIQAF